MTHLSYLSPHRYHNPSHNPNPNPNPNPKPNPNPYPCPKPDPDHDLKLISTSNHHTNPTLNLKETGV